MPCHALLCLVVSSSSWKNSCRAYPATLEARNAICAVAASGRSTADHSLFFFLLVVVCERRYGCNNVVGGSRRVARCCRGSSPQRVGGQLGIVVNDKWEKAGRRGGSVTTAHIIDDLGEKTSHSWHVDPFASKDFVCLFFLFLCGGCVKCGKCGKDFCISRRLEADWRRNRILSSILSTEICRTPRSRIIKLANVVSFLPITPKEGNGRCQSWRWLGVVDIPTFWLTFLKRRGTSGKRATFFFHEREESLWNTRAERHHSFSFNRTGRQPNPYVKLFNNLDRGWWRNTCPNNIFLDWYFSTEIDNKWSETGNIRQRTHYFTGCDVAFFT